MAFMAIIIAMAISKVTEEKMLAAIESVSATEKVVALEIQKAAQNGDWDTVSTLTTTGKKLTQIKAELSNEHSKLVPPAGHKKFVVEVTPGAIAYDYLSATPGISAHLLQVGQPVTLQLGVHEVQTVVLKYGRFQDRKNVAKFYAKHQINAGDQLQFSLDSTGKKWSVQKI
jgi:hypothetical protein